MVHVLLDRDQVCVPAWVTDLESFRRWSDSDDFPEKGKISYLKGEVWVDMSKEQIFTHALVKSEVGYALTGVAKKSGPGMYIVDGAFVTNRTANIATKPDGVFVSTASLESGQVRLIEGADEGTVELEGSPDMVLEVVSTSSVRKDTVDLRQAYWEADIREYWLIDARKPPIKFDILRWGPRGYTASPKQSGWVRSPVFAKAFRLSVRGGASGSPEYTLAVRST
jgi:Uma2 family endonuclease